MKQKTIYMLNLFFCFVQNKPVGQRFSGYSVTTLQIESYSINLPARINPFLHCERLLFGDRFCILISAVKQHLNVCLTDTNTEQFAFQENKPPKEVLRVTARRRRSVSGLVRGYGYGQVVFCLAPVVLLGINWRSRRVFLQ